MYFQQGEGISASSLIQIKQKMVKRKQIVLKLYLTLNYNWCSNEKKIEVPTGSLWKKFHPARDLKRTYFCGWLRYIYIFFCVRWLHIFVFFHWETFFPSWYGGTQKTFIPLQSQQQKRYKKVWPHERRSSVFIVNFEHVSLLFLVFLLLTSNR